MWNLRHHSLRILGYFRDRWEMLWFVRRFRLHVRSKPRLVALCASLVLLTLIVLVLRQPDTPEYDESQRSLWLKEAPPVDEMFIIAEDDRPPSSPLSQEDPALVIDGAAASLTGPFMSPYVIAPEEDFSKTTYLVKQPAGVVTFKNISVWDPSATNELKSFNTVDFSKCEYNKCAMTVNHSQADAVLFLADRLSKADKLPSFPRKPGQYWVFKTMEAPSRFGYYLFLNKTGFKEQFNLTMTFRMDSDLPTPYGRLVETFVTQVKDYESIYSAKTKNVAMFTTYCEIRSKSLDFVKKMAERVEVDIFGPCGNKQCSASGPIDWDSTKHKKLDPKECFPMLSKFYKFYLVFEVSLCRDFITEIFFQAFSDVNVLPVVRGGADYKTYFPPGTFVDSAEFTTPGGLADFLVDLAKDKDRYLQYLKNKHNYVGVSDFPDWQCKLCRHLHSFNGTRTYPDIHQWWTQIPCRDPGTDLPPLV